MSELKHLGQKGVNAPFYHLVYSGPNGLENVHPQGAGQCILLIPVFK